MNVNRQSAQEVSRSAPELFYDRNQTKNESYDGEKYTLYSKKLKNFFKKFAGGFGHFYTGVILIRNFIVYIVSF